jgi:hypothetical protein
MTDQFLNLVVVIAVIAGVVLDPSIGGENIDIKNMKMIWKLVDIIIVMISLYFVFIKKNNLYVVALIASLCMLFKTNFYSHDHGSKEHLQQLKMGSVLDGLILGVAMSSIFYKK